MVRLLLITCKLSASSGKRVVGVLYVAMIRRSQYCSRLPRKQSVVGQAACEVW